MLNVFKHGMLSLLTAVVFLFAVQSEVNAQSSPVAEFTVHTGNSSQLNTPVSASLEGVSLKLQQGVLQLYEITDGQDRPVASQLVAGSPDRLAWILDGETAAGIDRNFELRVVNSAQPTGSSTVKVADDGENLNVSIADKPVFSYRHARVGVPEGVNEIYSRQGGYIHPIQSPGGEVLSRIQPSDHYHHYGIWNPWVRTEFEGRNVDFWNLNSGQGTVRSERVIERVSGEVFGSFRALHHHVDFTSGEEKVAVNEQWEVTAWNVDPEQNVWLIDFVSTLNPATEEPLTILAYRYQGFSLRATERWNDNNATLLSSAGYDKSNGNGTRARWLDVNGESDVAEGSSGILFMSNPGNYNFPEQLRIWPTGANQGTGNVYINFNPAQEQDFVLEPGKKYALKYRMLVYDGKISPEQAEQYWDNYANPPRVDVNPVGTLSIGAN